LAHDDIDSPDIPKRASLGFQALHILVLKPLLLQSSGDKRPQQERHR
jgi:hypothetical protein